MYRMNKGMPFLFRRVGIPKTVNSRYRESFTLYPV